MYDITGTYMTETQEMLNNNLRTISEVIVPKGEGGFDGDILERKCQKEGFNC
ncbi:hypothetical protein Metlim_0158 [Methanoplanus limicola DSM 2279]|uniref:Uncharacterized protein n=1 Tax=Methanoplanus limicola DSM 2279 TaxID=937775 RepID=H1YZP9_9EURY|nr:hypothetical protein Metlim_0158 [Methanoplanus limicola DSM 2279]